jgi:hypothetical protein
MSDPAGIDKLTELISRPRRVTPSLIGGRRAQELSPNAARPDVVSSAPKQVKTSSSREVGTAEPPKEPAPEASSRPVFAARKVQVQLRAEQETWLHTIVATALSQGVRVSEADVVRVAVDRLRTGKASWPELKEAILAETRGRSRRR